MNKKASSRTKKSLHVCVDRPVSTLDIHHRMVHAIRHNPKNNPAKPGSKTHTLVKEFVKNPNMKMTPTQHITLYKMALLTDNKWKKGQTLTIAFMDGSALQRSKTIKFANYWTDKTKANANIILNFVTGKKAMIRISFVADDGSWSTIGTDCNLVAANKPTMNFGWLRDDTPDDEWERVVVHEFGHALGCIHEHQNPSGGIKWNKPVVYKYFEGPPNNWSKKDVDSNIFQNYSKNKTQFTKMDRTSIMMYFFPPEFTTDGYGTPENKHLSKTDISFIRAQYPK